MRVQITSTTSGVEPCDPADLAAVLTRTDGLVWVEAFRVE